jgi:hypothetical protein
VHDISVAVKVAVFHNAIQGLFARHYGLCLLFSQQPTKLRERSGFIPCPAFSEVFRDVFDSFFLLRLLPLFDAFHPAYNVHMAKPEASIMGQR